MYWFSSGFSSQGHLSEQRNKDFPHPSHLLQLIWGDTGMIPNHVNHVFSASPGPALGPPPDRICPEYLT